MTRSWTEQQVRFSESWFELLKKAEPGSMAQSWDAAQRAMATWHEAAQKALEAQKEFSKMVMSAAGPNGAPKR